MGVQWRKENPNPRVHRSSGKLGEPRFPLERVDPRVGIFLSPLDTHDGFYLSYGFFVQFGYYDRYCCIINMNMFIVIFLYLCKCICIFFVPLINLMRYFVIFVMFSIIKHNSYHVMVHDWNKNILSYLYVSNPSG